MKISKSYVAFLSGSVLAFFGGGASIRSRLLRTCAPLLIFIVLVNMEAGRYLSHGQAAICAVVTILSVQFILVRKTRWFESLLSQVEQEKEKLLLEKTTLQSHLFQFQKLEGIGKLAAGVAHDFNNVLSVILNFTQFLAEGQAPGSQERVDLDEIQKAARRGVALTRQLLIFSKKEITRPEVLDLNQLLIGFDKFIRRGIAEDVDLRLVLNSDLWKVEADPSQLELMFMNLAINARDAMPDGGILAIETSNLELTEDDSRLHVVMKPGKYVFVSVSDNGRGIHPDVIPHVFEPFFTTKPEGKGTGLGLSTVYGIVKKAKGYVWVYSHLGMGTTFKVYLPASMKGVFMDTQAVSVSAEGGREVVLVVEDDVAVRHTITRILSKAGYTILEASNGVEGLMLAEQFPRPIHLLLTDLIMPQMSGKELATQFQIKRPEVRVLYMSGYSESIITHHGILDSGNVFLEKPFNQQVLLESVRRALGSEVKEVEKVPASF